LKDAEICHILIDQVTADLLQWGRVLKDAEMTAADAVGGRARAASMGPRLEGRGNVPIWPPSTIWSQASMGPRLEGRGNCVSSVGA